MTTPDIRFPQGSSRSNEWATPAILFKALNAEFHFTLDPCATPENAKCKAYFTQEDDGLEQDWAGHRVFMNPPYGRGIERWMEKLATSECRIGVALVPAGVDTKWWWRWVEPYADEICFVIGRVRFEGSRWNAPFPSVVIIYRLGSQRHIWGTPWRLA